MAHEVDPIYLAQVLELIKSKPLSSKVALTLKSKSYLATVEAIKTIIRSKLDRAWGFELLLSSPPGWPMQLPEETDSDFMERFTIWLNQPHEPGKDYKPTHFIKNPPFN